MILSFWPVGSGWLRNTSAPDQRDNLYISWAEFIHSLINSFICAEFILFLVKRGKPTDEELEQLGIDIAEGWRKLGRRLKLDESTLQEIDNDYDQLSEKGYHMFMRWKQNTGANATYQALRDALQHKIVHRQDLVEFCFFRGNYLYNILLFPAILSFLDSGQCNMSRSQRLGSLCFVLAGNLIYSLSVSYRSLGSGT